MRTVCDPNVLVSGLLFRGYPRQILIRVARGALVNCTSSDLLRKVETVLRRPEFGLLPQQVSLIIGLFRDT